MFTAILSAVPKLLSLVNKIMDLITAERLKEAGMKEQQLENLRKLEELRKAADNARKNKPSGNILEHF